MNKDIAKGNFKQVKGKIKQQWGKLTDDEIDQMEGHADFAGLYWKQLEQWAQYLKEKGFDPENQLCTDDFAGHLAHNVNLSAKAICGLGAFAKLCEMRGDKAKSEEYFKLAREFAARKAFEGRSLTRTRFVSAGTCLLFGMTFLLSF